jgi:imidazolonepropionase-like amidohydrolase
MRFHDAVQLALVQVLCGSIVWSAEPMVIQNVAVFDGSRMLPPTSVSISEGKIRDIGPGLRIPSGARLIDGTGKTLLPGLIDSHVHLRTIEDLETAIAFGVTTCLDMFTLPELATRARAEQAAGRAVRRADMLSAGTPATAPLGHGTEYGVTIPTLSRAEDAEAFVEARLAEGSDYLKIIKDDGSAFGFRRPALNADTVGALIRAAHARRRLAIVHIATASDARDAINAGADGIAHIYSGPANADLARAAARRGLFWTPTLAVITHEASAVSREDAFAVVRALESAGVRILAGTDAPNPGTAYGETLHTEIALLAAAGIPPVRSLGAATSLAAAAFRLNDRGRIAAGLRADLLLVNGNPMLDIRATRRIAAVWKQGEIIYDNKH